MPRLSFIYPEMLWLLIVVGLIWAVALLPPHRLAPGRFWTSLALRSVIAIALVFAVAGAQLVLPVERLTTVFLLDGSDSMPPSARAQAETFIQEALQQMPPGDRAAIVVFGGNALVERAPSEERRLGRISSVPVATRTNIAEAIQLGLALFPADAEKRLVLLSDGGENEGRAIEAARLAAARGVPIDIVDLALNSDDAEALIARLEAPARVRDNQRATVIATVESTVAQRATVRLIGDGGVIAERFVDLQPGANQVPFQVEVSGSGFQRFRVQIEAEQDGRPQNNEASALIQIQGPPRVLLVAANRADAQALATGLQAANIIAEIVVPDMMPADLAGLSAYESVVLVNTPARALPVGAMAALPAYVRDLGRGLVMIGGEESFGVGGYGRTPIEEALPVYMDVRDREERPDLALVFVIDKSGSMDACHCASPDRGAMPLQAAGTRKVDIAKEAVAQAAALLGPHDTLGIVSFDSRAVQTMPPTTGATVEEVIEALSSLEPRGSTNVRAGLLEAEALLQGVDARLKHVILLTDGWGSGGDQVDIAERMRAQGMTLTVVAAGSGSADYLERLAMAGGGRYYPAQDMAEVPQIFVQETITTVGNYIIERPFVPVAVGESPILAGLGGLPPLFGFNGSTLKESARAVLETDDDQPLLAIWQYGLGRSAAWLSDARGKWAAEWIRWEGFPRFAGQLIEAVLPARGGQEVSAEMQVAGAETLIRLTTGPGQENLEVAATLIGTDGSRREIPLPQVGPQTYQGRFESPPPGTYLVQISGVAAGRPVLQETAGLVVPYSAEYRGAQANPALLAELATLTGGAPLTEAAAAFNRVDSGVTRAREIAMPLLALALLLLVFDIAVRRLLLRREDLAALRAWTIPRAAPARPAPVPGDPTLERLAGAKRRAQERISGHAASEPPPQSGSSAANPRDPATPAPPAPPPASPDATDDPLARLRAAKERARRRAAGEE
ncbi:MAG: VWA domain-containing protein [Oscillochloridaceae bacterium]|nr:VWA domain-containing protein [Chloroflexaceae bacterium]MDW8389764.1 VWA domain-containing protein [Oscillochloridaceae bacterium]